MKERKERERERVKKEEKEEGFFLKVPPAGESQVSDALCQGPPEHFWATPLREQVMTPLAFCP